jgi:small-conductance mechanosensitive channel
VNVTHEFWVRLAVAVTVIVLSFVLAKIVDRRLAKRELHPGIATRYRILRQSILGAIVFVGVGSALLVIPAVRGVALGILASSAVIGLIIGFAAQRTIGNFIAGLLIAFTQPVRLGDEIEFETTRGVVEEVGLIYTWVRTPDSDRLVIPNEKIVSEGLKNATIRNEQPVAEITVQLPLTADLRAAVDVLKRDTHEVAVTELADRATIAVRRIVRRRQSVARAESDLRIDVAERLRTAGILPAGE